VGGGVDSWKQTGGSEVNIIALSGAHLDAVRLSGRRMYPDVASPHQWFAAELLPGGGVEEPAARVPSVMARRVRAHVRRAVLGAATTRSLRPLPKALLPTSGDRNSKFLDIGEAPGPAKKASVGVLWCGIAPRFELSSSAWKSLAAVMISKLIPNNAP
jgi:hypothetical protein